MKSSYHGYTATVYPLVDFSGGKLSSVGQNTFGTGNAYAFFHDGPYDVDACHNNWGVPTSDIDSARIRDKLDASGVGRVTWNCG